MHTFGPLNLNPLLDCTVAQTFQFVQYCVRKLESEHYKCMQVIIDSTIISGRGKQVHCYR